MKKNQLNSLRAFCLENGLTPSKYHEIRKSLKENKQLTLYRLIDIDALSYLVNDYGISEELMLTGKGSMLKE